MSVATSADRSPLAAALGYRAEFGWSIIPCCTPQVHGSGQCVQHGWCEAPGKRALIAWGQYQHELPTEEELGVWWQRWPNANLALVTGELSGVVVVDLDGEVAQAEAQRRGGFERGPHSLTGRVGGRHVFLQWRPDAPTVFTRHAGIDFKGEGGYVLLPPSLHVSGNTYRWQIEPLLGEPLPLLPHWIDDLAREPQPTQQRAHLDQSIDGAPYGMRNDTLARLIGAWRYYEHLAETEAQARALAYAAGCQPPMTTNEALGVVRSIFRYPEHEGPAPPQLHEILGGQRRIIERPLPGFWISHAGLLDSEDEEALELVQGLVWQGRAHWLFSGPGAGKTILAYALGLHVAAGREFLGRAVRQGPVLILEEDSAPSVIRDYGRLLEDIYELEHEAPLYFNKTRGVRLRTRQDYDLVRQAVDAAPEKPVLVILDTCERLVPSKDFDTAELEWLGLLLAELASQNIACIVIDHTRKHQSQATDADPLDELYGGRAKSAITDIIWRIEGKIETRARFTCVKFRGDVPAAFELTFDDMQGFQIKTDKVTFKPPEQAVMRVLNNIRDWLKAAAINDAIQAGGGRQLAQRTLVRALSRLVEHGAVERQGDNRDTVYRANRGASTLWQ